MNPANLWSPRQWALFFPTFAAVTEVPYIGFRKRLFAVLLLSVLSLSILPVRSLHDVFATHSDEFTGCGHDNHRHETCVYDASLVCKTELQVVDLPYEYYSVIFRYYSVRFLDRQFSSYSEEGVIQYFFQNSSRGPPSVNL